MKIAFIYRDITFQAPLGVMYLSAFLKRSGHDCYSFLIEQDAVDDLVKFKPDFLCYTVTTSNYKFYVEYNKTIKRLFGAMSLFGGPHATFFPELIMEPDIDGVCMGEGEEALLDLVTRVEKKEDYLNAPNWVFKADGKVIKNRCRKLETGIDSYPFPDRMTFFKTPRLRRSSIWVFIGSRGCPYQCSYCHNHLMNTIYADGPRVRFRAPENITREIHEVRREYPVKQIIFTDDTFNLNKKWLEELSARYAKEVGIPYSCYIRANLVDDEVGEWLRRSNCAVAYLGIESGNERVRKEVLNRPMSDRDIINASCVLNRNKIKIVALNILGIPGTTFSDDLDTLKLNIRCRPYQAVGQLLQPYPNTRIYDYSVQLNLFHEEDVSRLGDLLTDSKLSFDPGHLKKVTILRDLFAFLVKFPFLFKFFPMFLVLPRAILYNISKAYYGYLKLRLFPVFSGPGQILLGIVNFYNREKKGVS